jgi:hypothetical protein
MGRLFASIFVGANGVESGAVGALFVGSVASTLVSFALGVVRALAALDSTSKGSARGWSGFIGVGRRKGAVGNAVNGSVGVFSIVTDTGAGGACSASILVNIIRKGCCVVMVVVGRRIGGGNIKTSVVVVVPINKNFGFAASAIFL